MSSPRLPLTVTRPDLVACLNCRWLPSWLTSAQPSSSSSRMTSRTFTRRRYHRRLQGVEMRTTIMAAYVGVQVAPFATVVPIARVGTSRLSSSLRRRRCRRDDRSEQLVHGARRIEDLRHIGLEDNRNRRFDVFFMTLLLHPRRPARANQSDSSGTFCKADNEQPRLRRKAHNQLTCLAFRVVGIVENTR